PEIAVKMPILTVSPEICAWAICIWAAADMINATAKPARAVRLIIVLLFLLDPEVVVQLAEVSRQFGIAEAVDDPPVLDDVMAVGNRRGKPEILLDQENGKSLLLQGTDDITDLLDDDRRQPLGRLVEQ